MSLDLSKLQNVKRAPDGIICGCPACIKEGGDSGKSHLKIYPNGAFRCAKYGKDLNHNRIIRGVLRGLAGETEEVTFIDPTPTLSVDKIYPEDSLNKLIRNHEYWINRGAKEEIMDSLEGGISPDDHKHKLSGRYIIPIRNIEGQIVGFSGRLLNNSSYAPRYKHLFRSSKTCWPWHLAGPSIEKTGKVVLNEGWSEYIFLAGSGITNTISLFGLNLNSVIIKQLVAARVEKIVISTNNDKDETEKVKKGRLKAIDIKKELSSFFNEDNIVIRHPESDWGEATEDERQEFREEIERL